MQKKYEKKLEKIQKISLVIPQRQKDAINGFEKLNISRLWDFGGKQTTTKKTIA